ncbi:hypothetical protein AA0117_g11634 [Alternaria alternata]|uniref:Uncharacterized protein n=1 Tax=Alternaria alternata TaxID=5599 RepID=A0A4Q4N1R8_ALTAL|nr:hypothetical protein AA0117_g11634 [Alternaria alternata]
MAAKTWFLSLGTTFTPDGMIRLGAVIKDFKRPTLILLEPDVDTDPKINLPPVEILLEQNHTHSRNLSGSVGGEIWAKFLDLASASMRLELEKRNKLEYGAADHDVHQFKRSLTPESLKAIVSQPAVRQYIDSGAFGKRPVYIVSGLRIVKTAMMVTVDKNYTRGGGLKGSGPPAGTVPVEAGADIHGDRRRDNIDSWVTAPGIVFAYRLNVIREKKGENRESEMFSHRTAFMTGIGDEEVEMEISEVLAEELLEDPEEDYSDLVEHGIGEEDTCI